MDDSTNNSLWASIRKNAVGLGLFAIVTAGSIGIAQVATKESIEHNVRVAQAKALNEIVPSDSYDNDLLNDTLLLANNDTRLLGPIAEDAVAYVARKNGKVKTIILPVTAPDGYTANIDMIVGIHVDGTLAGVRVINHKETPGLGDKIEAKKSPWILEFVGRSLNNPEVDLWGVKKDGGEFDQFTGATITPRAVVRSIQLALSFFQQHKKELIINQPYELGSSPFRISPSKTNFSKNSPSIQENLTYGE